MTVYLGGLIWVAGAALTAALIASLVRWLGATEGAARNNEAAGQVFTLVGGVQAVLVTFVLISLFDGVGAAKEQAYTEANSLVGAVWAAEAASDSSGAQARKAARAYAKTVVTEEWPRMRADGTVRSDGWSDLERVRAAIETVPSKSEWTATQKSKALDHLSAVYEARQSRLAAAKDTVDEVVWFALIVGAVMVMTLPLMFGGHRPTAHIVIVAVLAATMTLLLYATHQLENPYGGGAHVDPAAFQSALHRLR